MKEVVREQLARAMTSVHLSFDLWTTPVKRRAFLGLVVHYIDDLGSLKTTLLALKRMRGNHSGINQSATIWEALCEFGIQHKVGNCTIDNASNNDTALADLAERMLAIGVEYNPEESRIRCLGHIINLSV